MVTERLLRAEHRATMLVSTDGADLLDQLASYQHAATNTWLERRGAEARGA
jgi:hypothetical protein